MSPKQNGSGPRQRTTKLSTTESTTSSTTRDAVARTVAETRAEIDERVDRGRQRSGYEIPRKTLHSSISIVVSYLWLSHPQVPNCIRGLSIALVIIASADFLRFRSPSFERTYEKVLGLLMREHERESINGVIYYLVGVIFCLTLYPRDIAVLSIIQLSLCDTAASVFGRLYGRYTPQLPLQGLVFGHKKSVAGTTAAVAVGACASYYFWTRLAFRGDELDTSWMPIARQSLWKGASSLSPTRIPRLPSPQSTLSLPRLVALNGLTAGLAEALNVCSLDDNLTLPIVYGALTWGAMYLLG